MGKYHSFIFLLLVTKCLTAQSQPAWQPDNGDGTYKNPVLHADYSDPDAIRVGTDYYMTASSFNQIPGLPLLHSKDLVNWELIGYALSQQLPASKYDLVQHGNGVWAPAIRFHNNQFYIYFPDPDTGIYVIKASSIKGPWSTPKLIVKGKGLIDPCPLWDDNGKAYLVHAFAGSRAGIKSLVAIRSLSADGMSSPGESVIVYDGHESDPTIEGPKLYKRNGWYYIFAPAGGVKIGWQLVLRSRSVFGPYERKVVMDQGQTAVNGPHQGAWVQTPTGESWFLHFQDKEAYGRIVHLQPMIWKGDWPVIGSDPDGDGKGEPVLTHNKPAQGNIISLPASDEFNNRAPGLQWQWQANPKPFWSFMEKGRLRLYAMPRPGDDKNDWNCPNLFMQKWPAEEFMITTRISFHPGRAGEEAGLIIFGTDYARLSITGEPGDQSIQAFYCEGADKGNEENANQIEKTTGDWVYFRAEIRKGALCQFSWSSDSIHFREIGPVFSAKPGKWVGARIGLYCTSVQRSNDAGYADFDWFRVMPLINK